MLRVGMGYDRNSRLEVGMGYDRNSRLEVAFTILHPVKITFGMSHGVGSALLPTELPYFPFHGSERRIFGTFGEVFPGTTIRSVRAGDIESQLSGQAALRESNATIATDEVLHLGDTAGLNLGESGGFFTGIVTSTQYEQGSDTRMYTVKSSEDDDYTVTWPVADAFSFSESLNPDDYYNQVTIDKDIVKLIEEVPVSYSYTVGGVTKSREVKRHHGWTDAYNVIETYKDESAETRETFHHQPLFDPTHGKVLNFLIRKLAAFLPR